VTSTFVTAVSGTWSWRSAWWKDGSDFWAYMARYGIYPARPHGRTYKWSTDLGNSIWFWARRRSQWEAAGDALAYFLDHMPEEHRVVIAHSHGGQCVAYAAAQGVKIRSLITVATPVRYDMQPIWAQARPNIGTWWHVFDADVDHVAWWGAFGDGRIGNVRHFDIADRNIRLKGIDHSRPLNNPDRFHLWEDTGAIAMLKGTPS
jgi:hypothetical protein